MLRLYSNAVRLVPGLLLCLALTGCGEPEQVAQTLAPVAYHGSDECHVCGMIITDFPGPKGQAVGKAGVKKFCSTAELLGWWLQPENRTSGARLYVHDMGGSAWDAPNDGRMIDATGAWYVAGTSLKGAMGAVLASFSDEQAARQLAALHGGQVLRFEDIDQALLQQTSAAAHGTH